MLVAVWLFFFFFNATATPEIYPLPLHDALPIWRRNQHDCKITDSIRETPRITCCRSVAPPVRRPTMPSPKKLSPGDSPRDYVGVELRTARRSEEHTSELQSQSNLVCRLLLEKKK